MPTLFIRIGLGRMFPCGTWESYVATLAFSDPCRVSRTGNAWASPDLGVAAASVLIAGMIAKNSVTVPNSQAVSATAVAPLEVLRRFLGGIDIQDFQKGFYLLPEVPC
jgi:hypothetical protein